MTVTAEARQTLTAALTVALEAWPVSATRPLELAAPCVYVDVASRREGDDQGAPLTVVTFPVVAVVDGADDAQVLALDTVGDTIWDVARDLDGGPVSAIADDVAVGGPRLRYLVTTVDVIVARPTLCGINGAAALELDLQEATT